MKYEELTKNFNPTFRVGLYGMTVEQKKQIEDILGKEFYSFYEASSVKNNELLNRPDIILTTRNDETLNEIKKICGALVLFVTETNEARFDAVCFSDEKSIEISKQRILEDAIIGNTGKISQIINQSDDDLSIIFELLKKKDIHTYHHVLNVANYAEQICREIGIDEENIKRIRLGAYLYDLGKLCLPNSVLFNTTPKLSEEKWDLMTKHVDMAISLIPDKYIGASFLDIREMIVEHHERLDGSGYPDKIKDISFGARLLAVCDTYDELMAKCSYQDKHTPEQAFLVLHELSDGTPAKLDKEIVETLEHILTRKPITSTPQNKQYHK